MGAYGQIAKRFDRWAPAYDECTLRPLYDAAHAGVLAAVVSSMGVPGRVLDVGCGTGRLLVASSRVFPRAVLVGIDVSAAMLTVAHGLASHRSALAQAAAEQLPFADATFDLIVSTFSFRHWSDQHAGMREIVRVLAPGGVFGLAGAFEHRRRAFTSQLTSRARRPPAMVGAALASAGLQPVTVAGVDGFGPIPEITVVVARRRVDVRVL